jgi:hypothetical protein
MPRLYCRKKKQQVDRTKIAECLEKISNGFTIRQASREVGLPEATVRRHFHADAIGKTLALPGGTPSLPIETEANIATIAKIASSNGFKYRSRS